MVYAVFINYLVIRAVFNLIFSINYLQKQIYFHSLKKKHMKTLQLTTSEYYVFQQIALNNNEMFVHCYDKQTKLVEIVVSELFCEAFGY